MQYGLIGEKLGHSFSKEIHEQLQAIPYELTPLTSKQFQDFMEHKEFLGINVTIPYKQQVIPYLDTIDERAKRIGAVNCIVNEHQQLIGYNTDYHGIKYMLEKHGVVVANKTIAILGSGGTSKTALCVMQDLQAATIYRVSRTSKEDCITYEQLIAISNQIDILVNTTPSGMYPQVEHSALSLIPFQKLEWVIDVIFNPLQTTLMQQAKDLGIKAIGGLEMLVAQAVYASEYFHHTTYPKSCIDTIYQQLYRKKQNIVLIGMPTSGKSTLAKQLASKLHLPISELDEMIEERAKMDIPTIFKTKGEAYFRTLETDVLKEVCLQNGRIISCGGGVIKTDVNLAYLRYNSIILWIDRPLALLQADGYRPLADDLTKLTNLYKERKDIYQAWCDYRIVNDTSLAETIDKIMEVYHEANNY